MSKEKKPLEVDKPINVDKMMGKLLSTPKPKKKVKKKVKKKG